MRFGPLVLLIPLLGCASTPVAHVGPVTGVVVADGEVFSCSQAGVRRAETWYRPGFRVTCIDVRGDWLVVGGGDPAESGTVALYSRDGDELAERVVSGDLVYSVSISPDRDAVAIGCADGSVRRLSIPSLEVEAEYTKHTAPCRAVRFSGDGEFLATGGLDGLVYLHALGKRAEHVIKDHTAGVECVLFRGDRLYSGARDGKVRVHDHGRLVRTYQGMRNPVLALAQRNDEVLAGLRDGRILRLSPDDATYQPAWAVDPPLFAMTAANDELIVGRVSHTLSLPLDPDAEFFRQRKPK